MLLSLAYPLCDLWFSANVCLALTLDKQHKIEIIVASVVSNQNNAQLVCIHLQVTFCFFARINRVDFWLHVLLKAYAAKLSQHLCY